MDNIANRSSWKNHPIDNPKRIEIDLHFTNEQFEKLKRGLIPHEMDDKWFIFYEEGWLFFHRSWTGFGFWRAPVVKEGNGYSINEFWAERNKEKYLNEYDEYDRETLAYLIAVELLGVDVSKIYAPLNIKSDVEIAQARRNFGRLLMKNKPIDYTKKIKSVLFGVAVGDALGLPVQCKSREYLKQKPVKIMIGYGTFDMPPGTWSDDSSLTFCLAEALTKGFDLNIIAQNFLNWFYKGYWTPKGKAFDIGNTTSEAIYRLSQGAFLEVAGSTSDFSNGNGSLMRISPLVFYIKDKPIEARFEITRQVSSITHRHIRSVIACFYYLEFLRQLLSSSDKFVIYKDLQKEVPDFLNSIKVEREEIAKFNRLLKENIYEQPEEKMSSSGYVVDTLEASIWCLLTTDNFKGAILKAVNLGEDTDTVGAVTGALLGLLYGYESIPKEWINELARKGDIEELAERLGEKV